MSGTSLDGLDIALCTISGSGDHTEANVTHFMTVGYTPAQKLKLKAVSSVEAVALKELCHLHTQVGILHAGMIRSALKEWGLEPGDVDCIASHGQTVFHDPASAQSDGEKQTDGEKQINSTLQIGDGDQIAAQTGILTISDFRQKHIAHGGEGAPMAALVDRILFGNEKEDRVLLNIGGIANYTLLPAKSSRDQKGFTTDTGPGNTLIDNTVQKFFDQPFDKDGLIAASGSVRYDLLRAMLNDLWFKEKGSKSTGPEYFNLGWIERQLKTEGLDLQSVSPEDLVATVTELSAVTITQNLSRHPAASQKSSIYVSGGGAHNPVLIKRLSELLPDADLQNFSKLGFDPDAKEGLIFAVLANEMLAGEGFPMETESGVKKINFGKISFPE